MEVESENRTHRGYLKAYIGTPSDEVYGLYAVFQAATQGAEKGHRICKLNRRITRRRTSVRRAVKFADSKRHFKSKFVPTNFHLKQKGTGKSYAFCGLCSFSNRIRCERRR